MEETKRNPRFPGICGVQLSAQSNYLWCPVILCVAHAPKGQHYVNLNKLPQTRWPLSEDLEMRQMIKRSMINIFQRNGAECLMYHSYIASEL